MAILTDITELESVIRTQADTSLMPINPPVGSWLIDFENQQMVVGYTENGMDVLKQSIILTLNTQRVAWLIYSTDYGQEFKSYLATHESDYAMAMIPTLISNALMVDDRITGCKVENVKPSFGFMTCDVRLNTIFGELNIEDFEVNL